MEQLGSERLEGLKRRAWRSMSRRAAAGILLYPFACLVVAYAAGFTATRPSLFFALFTASLVLAALRIYLTLRFDSLYTTRPALWQGLFGCGLIATLVIWTTISCWTLITHGFQGAAFLALLASAIMCNLSISTYTASRVLIALFLLILILPHAAVLAFLASPATRLMALAAVLYGAYLWTAGRRLNASYQKGRESSELLAIRAAELEQATLDYQRIFEHAHDAIVILDPEREVVLDVNPQACATYGFSRQAFVGLPLRAFSKDVESDETHVQETMKKGSDYRFETVQYRQDGTEMILEVTAAISEYRGRRAILSINRDVTERRRGEEELVRHRLHLEELVQERTLRLEEVVSRLEAKNLELERKQGEVEANNAEMERFTYTVSHDLKSPLITIRGFLGLLEKDAAAGDVKRMRRDMERIGAAVETMGQLLDELLELSRIGRVIHPPEDVPFGQLVHDAIARVAGQIAESKVEVEVAPGLPAVRGDRLRLLEVLQNLIENAVKFMGDEQRPRIEIGARLEEQPIVWFVSDNGTGIDPRYHDKVFGLFERLERVEDGTGVGLALVQRIVEVHGGRIWVESEGDGHGSTFCFTLEADQAFPTT